MQRGHDLNSAESVCKVEIVLERMIESAGERGFSTDESPVFEGSRSEPEIPLRLLYLTRELFVLSGYS